MKPLRIAVCEDMPGDINHLRCCIARSGTPAQVEAFESGETLLEAFHPGRYDLIFLDIYLAGIKGVDAARTIREKDGGVMLAFTTTSLDHTLDSYRLGALKYLEKPVKAEEVADTLALAEMKRRKRASITLLIGGRDTEVILDEILFFEVRDHAVLIHTASGVLQTSQTVRLDDIDAKLPSPPFLRYHHSFLVNLRHVQSVDRDFIMRNGGRAYIRRDDVKKCTEAFLSYLLDEVGRDDT